MSRNKRGFGAHFGPLASGPLRTVTSIMKTLPPIPLATTPAPAPRERFMGRHLGMAWVQWAVAAVTALAWWGMCMLAAVATPAAHAQVNDAAALQGQVQALLSQQTAPLPPAGQDAAVPGAKPWRMAFELGQLDPRLKLAPCDKVRAYVPDGAPLWGKTRVGLRCEQGPVRWNVYWPIAIQVWGQALVATQPLRPGTVVSAADVRLAEVDLAANPSPALVRTADIVGRFVSRAIEPGHSLRQDDVKARRWFAAGDTVRLQVQGSGFQIAAEGTAMSHGDEGHCARIRTEIGKVVCGMPVGDRLAELTL